MKIPAQGGAKARKSCCDQASAFARWRRKKGTTYSGTAERISPARRRNSEGRKRLYMISAGIHGGSIRDTRERPRTV